MHTLPPFAPVVMLPGVHSPFLYFDVSANTVEHLTLVGDPHAALGLQTLHWVQEVQPDSLPADDAEWNAGEIRLMGMSGLVCRAAIDGYFLLRERHISTATREHLLTAPEAEIVAFGASNASASSYGMLGRLVLPPDCTEALWAVPSTSDSPVIGAVRADEAAAEAAQTAFEGTASFEGLREMWMLNEGENESFQTFWSSHLEALEIWTIDANGHQLVVYGLRMAHENFLLIWELCNADWGLARLLHESYCGVPTRVSGTDLDRDGLTDVVISTEASSSEAFTGMTLGSDGYTVLYRVDGRCL